MRKNTLASDRRCAQQYVEYSKTSMSSMILSPRFVPSCGKSSLKSMYKPSTSAIYRERNNTFLPEEEEKNVLDANDQIGYLLIPGYALIPKE